MKPRAALQPVGVKRHHPGHVEARDDLAGGAELDLVPQVYADQRRVHEGEAFAHGHAEVIHESEECCAGAALLAVDHDKVRRDPGLVYAVISELVSDFPADREK
jgi:hypothetical protein